MTLRPLILVPLIVLAALALWLATRQTTAPSPKPAVVQPATIVQPTAPETPQPDPAKAPEKPSEQPYFPPAVHDSKLASLVDRNARNRISSDMSTRFPTAEPDDFPALLSVVADIKDGDTERHEAVALLKRSRCPDLLESLGKVLDNPAEGYRFRAFAMQHLGGLVPDVNSDPEGNKKMLDRMHAALGDRHFQVRGQALQNLCRLKDSAGKDTAVKWLTEYKPCCVDNGDKPVAPEKEREGILNQAIRCCKDLGLKEQIPNIRPFARDNSEVVRIAALSVLSDWLDGESLEAMQEAAESPSVRLRNCGKAAVGKMGKGAAGVEKDKGKAAIRAAEKQEQATEMF
jgi:hypothetical protein